MNTQTIEPQTPVIFPIIEPHNLPTFTKGLQAFVKQYLSEYEVENVERVTEFLFENHSLTDLLLEVPMQIRTYFGDNQRLKLEVLTEPDFPASKELWVEVLTALSAKEARQIMDTFDEKWWFDNMDRADCKLSIGLEYV